MIFFIPYFTFGEDLRCVFEGNAGLTLVMVAADDDDVRSMDGQHHPGRRNRRSHGADCGPIQKPVSRRDFILGKFVGVLGATAILYLVLGQYFIAWIPYKVVYDARETAATEPNPRNVPMK